MEESGLLAIGIRSGVLFKVLWVVESYLRPQKWLSVKDGQTLDLTASLHSVLQRRSRNSKNHDKGKSKVEQCSHTSHWSLTGAEEVEIVSQRPSVVTASLKRLSSSAVERHCGFSMKAKKKQSLPERKRCLVLESKQCSVIPVRGHRSILQGANILCSQNQTRTHNVEHSHPP